MSFVKHPGLPGRVYIPDTPFDTVPKHKCPDCFGCQMCPESRCRVCKNRKSVNQIIEGSTQNNSSGGER